MEEFLKVKAEELDYLIKERENIDNKLKKSKEDKDNLEAISILIKELSEQLSSQEVADTSKELYDWNLERDTLDAKTSKNKRDKKDISDINDILKELSLKLKEISNRKNIEEYKNDLKNSQKQLENYNNQLEILNGIKEKIDASVYEEAQSKLQEKINKEKEILSYNERIISVYNSLKDNNYKLNIFSKIDEQKAIRSVYMKEVPNDLLINADSMKFYLNQIKIDEIEIEKLSKEISSLSQEYTIKKEKFDLEEANRIQREMNIINNYLEKAKKRFDKNTRIVSSYEKIIASNQIIKSLSNKLSTTDTREKLSNIIDNCQKILPENLQKEASDEAIEKADQESNVSKSISVEKLKEEYNDIQNKIERYLKTNGQTESEELETLLSQAEKLNRLIEQNGGKNIISLFNNYKETESSMPKFNTLNTSVDELNKNYDFNETFINNLNNFSDENIQISNKIVSSNTQVDEQENKEEKQDGAEKLSSSEKLIQPEKSLLNGVENSLEETDEKSKLQHFNTFLGIEPSTVDLKRESKEEDGTEKLSSSERLIQPEKSLLNDVENSLEETDEKSKLQRLSPILNMEDSVIDLREKSQEENMVSDKKEQNITLRPFFDKERSIESVNSSSNEENNQHFEAKAEEYLDDEEEDDYYDDDFDRDFLERNADELNHTMPNHEEKESKEKSRRFKRVRKKVIRIRKSRKDSIRKIVSKISMLATVLVLMATAGGCSNQKDQLSEEPIMWIDDENGNEIPVGISDEDDAIQVTYDNGEEQTVEQSDSIEESSDVNEINYSDTQNIPDQISDEPTSNDQIENTDIQENLTYLEEDATQYNFDETSNQILKIGSEVTINGSIHRNVYDAYLNENPYNSYFGSNPKRVIIGTGIVNNDGMNVVYASTPGANQKIDELLNDGGEMVSILTANKEQYLQNYDGSTLLTPEDVNTYAEGWYNINDVSFENTKGMSK